MKSIITISKYVLIFILFLALTCCTNSRYIVSSVATGNTYPAVESDSQIKVHMFGDTPLLEEVGVIQILVRSEFNDRIDEVVKRAKMEARKLGANVIVLNRQAIVNFQTTKSVSPDPSNLTNSYTIPVTLETPKYVFLAGRLK